MLLTTIERNNTGNKFVIYSGLEMWHFFSCDNEKAYKRIIKKLGFEFCDNWEEVRDGEFKKNYLKGTITDISFTSRDQIPYKAKPIIALSNGSKVKCYYLRQGEDLLFFRPNPNYKKIYKPLSLKRHIKHTLKYGNY